ncbi:MAG: 2-oxo acid dehydrogenase subunit E2 [Fimbriimonadaceae bacterium]|nr:2-oxo acid dehydrogenase subunit E2 [Fimbriimonadaceae bacterium]
MAVEILMPELGESVHEGTVSRWLKKVGDFVKEDEPVVEIMTDKVNTELPSPASGYLVRILIPEGDPVEVFKAMGIIDDAMPADGAPAPNGATPKEAPPVVPKTAPAPETPAEPVEPGRRWYSPVVISMAKAKGVTEAELASVVGSGSGGRVTKKDLESYLASGRKPGAPAARRFDAPPVAPTVVGPDQELVPLVGMRKMIAEAMVRSAAVPTVSTTVQIDVSRMVEFREKNKEGFQQAYGVKLTYTPFFIKAVTEALQEFPLVNASLQPDNKILKNRGVHMGVAVSLGKAGDEGLIVPVIRDCHAKSIVQIARDLEDIAKRARANALELADVQGGTFTLTNPGSYGALFGTPMINAPQAGILGTYGIQKVPLIVNDMIAIRSVMYVVLTYDHRLVDGLLAGRFLQSIRLKLEGFDFLK